MDHTLPEYRDNKSQLVLSLPKFDALNPLCAQ